jgi:hypothetical protein
LLAGTLIGTCGFFALLRVSLSGTRWRVAALVAWKTRSTVGCIEDHTTEQGNPMNQSAPKSKPINIYEMTLDELRTQLVRMVNETGVYQFSGKLRRRNRPPPGAGIRRARQRHRGKSRPNRQSHNLGDHRQCRRRRRVCRSCRAGARSLGHNLCAAAADHVFSAVWQWGKNGRFIFPIPQTDGDAGDSARASIDAVAERIRKTASMWHEEPPESFGWSVT